MSGRVEVIAFPGTSGSFSGVAAQEAFPNGQCAGFPTFPEAAKAVIEGLADYALLPVENSFAGAVLPTYSLLEKLPLHIVGETMKAVRHNLLGVPGATLAGIRRIASHPQAIAQCDVFLQGMKGVQITPSETRRFPRGRGGTGRPVICGDCERGGGAQFRADCAGEKHTDQQCQYDALPDSFAH